MALEWSNDIMVAQLADEPALSDELALVVDQVGGLDADKRPNAVLDFSAVSYINSSNIAQLLRMRKLLDEGKRRLRICGVSDEVWSVLLVTGLDKVFTFAPDTMTALAGLQLDAAGDA